MSKALAAPFVRFQKGRIRFVQNVAELSNEKKNIEVLQNACVFALLKPLLHDRIESVQQAAAISLSRLAFHNEELAEVLVQNEILPQLVKDLLHKSKYYKQSACNTLRNVARHNESLAAHVVQAGSLEVLVACADEFDPVVKSSAVWALSSIAKHNADLANEIIKANALETIIQCV